MQLKYNEINDNQLISSDTTFLEYFQDWIKINEENKISQSTLNRYYNALNIFDEKFGNTAIKDFSQLKYREMLKEYAEGYFIGGHKKRHTKASVQELNNCFSQAFKDALNEEIIERDPTWNAPIYEKKPTKKEEVKFMSLTEYKKLKLCSTCKNELSYLAIFILIVAGGRFGEVQNYNVTI